MNQFLENLNNGLLMLVIVLLLLTLIKNSLKGSPLIGVSPLRQVSVMSLVHRVQQRPGDCFRQQS